MTFFHHAESSVWLLSITLVPSSYLVILIVGIKLARTTKLKAFSIIAIGFGLLMLRPFANLFGTATIAPTIRAMEFFRFTEALLELVGPILIMIGFCKLYLNRTSERGSE